MTEQAGETPKKKSWQRRVIVFVIGFAISLVVGRIIQTVSDPLWLEQAKRDQDQLIATLLHTSPIGVADRFWTELTGAFNGDSTNGSQAGLMGQGLGVWSPIVALYFTVMRFFSEGGVVVVIQLALGLLAVGVYNYVRSNGREILYEEFITNIVWGPFAVVIAASLIGGALWLLMFVGLNVLSGITAFAATAAAATGVIGFCYVCVTKLAEKGLEHVVTPKI